MSAPQTPLGATPGPWQACEPECDDVWQTANPTRCGGCDIRIIAPHGAYKMTVAVVYDSEANAALIASAPDLLAEVTKLRLQVSALRDAVHEALAWPDTDPTRAKLRAALNA